MTFFGLLTLLIIAAICGAIGQSISGYSLGGCLISIVVGFVGAFIGKWLAAELGLTYLLPVDIDGETFPIIWSIIGSALFTLGIGLLTRGRKPV